MHARGAHFTKEHLAVSATELSQVCAVTNARSGATCGKTNNTPHTLLRGKLDAFSRAQIAKTCNWAAAA